MVKYKYFNLNPLGLKENDCVCRAITFATGLSYGEIRKKLKYVGKLLDCDSLCVCCYKFLLDDIFNYNREYCYDMTLAEFAETHKQGLYLVRSDGHISVLCDYCIYDIWACRDMVLTNAWRVE